MPWTHYASILRGDEYYGHTESHIWNSLDGAALKRLCLYPVQSVLATTVAATGHIEPVF